MSKHSLLMLACCLVPLALLGVVAVAGIDLGGILPFAIILLCPLMHILMMRGMKGHDHSEHQPASDVGSAAESCHGKAATIEAETASSRR